MRFEAAIFDFDGVLVQMDRQRAVSFFQGRAPLPVKALTQRWEAWCSSHVGEHPQAQEMWRIFWEALGAELDIPRGALQEICSFDYMGLFPACSETKDALREARQLGLKLGVLSNSALPKLESPSAPLDLGRLVDFIGVPGHGRPVKPEREAYLDIARSLGTVPERCLFFDNEVPFVQAARDVGMRGYLVYRGAGTPPDDPAVVRDLSGLRALIEAG